MTTARLRIGNYTFSLLPKESLDFDLSRNVYKLDTVGTPTYQDLGINDKKLSFTGSIVTADAWSQAELLERLMDTGLPQTLLYGPIQRTVRLNSFSPKYIRSDRVDYSIDLILIPPKSGYNAPQQPSIANTTLPTKAPPATTSTAYIAQYADSTYMVKQGDTLWGISQRVLGSSASANDIATLAHTIAKANGLANPKSLTVGQVLQIPTSASNIQNANAAYVTRQTATVSTAGINFLQTMEGAVRFTTGSTG